MIVQDCYSVSKQKSHQIMQPEVLLVKKDIFLEAKFKFVDLEQKYDENVLNYNHKIGENDPTLSSFVPELRLWHTDDYGKVVLKDPDFKYVALSIQNSRFLKCNFDALIATFADDKESYEIPSQTLSTKNVKRSTTKIEVGFVTSSILSYFFSRKLKSFEGILKITFEPNETSDLKHALQLEFSVLKMPKQPEDFRIICENKEVKFNKAFLCKISDVFAAMIENPHTSESQQGFVVIENVRAETIKRFQKIVCKGNVKKEDLNVELLLFADRYNIQPLVKLSKAQIKKSISRENLIDVIRASDALNDDELLKAAVNFVSENKGSFETNPEFMEMMESNPKCSAKMWGMLMFKNK